MNVVTSLTNQASAVWKRASLMMLQMAHDTLEMKAQLAGMLMLKRAHSTGFLGCRSTELACKCRISVPVQADWVRR